MEKHPAEWSLLKGYCRITISRFYRDRQVFEILETAVLPQLAATAAKTGKQNLRCWSVGCASGEEPYTLALLWELRLKSQHSGVNVHILATDADPQILQRAEAASYPPSSIRELPEDLKKKGFTFQKNRYNLKPAFRSNIVFKKQDFSENLPSGSFHLIFCRNLAFTYFDEEIQKKILAAIENILIPGGFLVVGAHENLSLSESRLFKIAKCIYQKPKE